MKNIIIRIDGDKGTDKAYFGMLIADLLKHYEIDVAYIDPAIERAMEEGTLDKEKVQISIKIEPNKL